MKMTTSKMLCGLSIIAVVAGLTGCVTAPTSTGFTGTSGQIQPGSGTKPGIGSYTAKAVMTNQSSGSIWFTPPVGKTQGVLTDTAHQSYNPPYSCVVEAFEYPTLRNWYAVNSVKFPVSPGCRYQFTTYIKNQLPPPTDKAKLTSNIAWSP